jgi:perosamine synthetase
MWKMGAPVATPISLRDCLAGISGLRNGDEHRTAFEKDVRNLLGAPFVRATNSGRSALFVTLEAMKKCGERDEVVIPAFVCPSVGRAVVKAGLKPVLCDVGPHGSGLDMESLERALSGRTLAVVTAHLYGYPADIRPIVELSHAAGALVIEDAAQAFGAKLRGQYCGTMADAGIFSFAMSKALWSNGGGLIATSRPELADPIDRVLDGSPRMLRLREAADIGKFAVVALLVRCHHLGPLASLWGTKMRGRYDCEDFSVYRCQSSRSALGRVLLAGFDQITRTRRRNALYFSESLAGFSELLLPYPDPEADPVFLRFPIIVNDTRLKAELLRGLHSRGVNASEMYTLQSCEALRGLAARGGSCPRAEYLAGRMLNLPTHPFMRGSDLEDAVAVFHAQLGGLQPHSARTAVVAR